MDNKRGNKSPGGDPNGNRNNRQSLMILLICILVSMMCMSFFSGLLSDSSSRKITYDEFIRMLDEGEVKTVVINTDTIDITPKSADSSAAMVKYYTTRTEDVTALTERLAEAGVTFSRKENSVAMEIMETVLSFLLPFVFFMIIISVFMNRMNMGGGIMGVGRNRAKTYVQKNTGITFKDVAGEDEAKESLQEVVEFLHNPGRYVEIGAKLPKGALLVGPPGTGKTLLAKAVAGEANVPFFSLSGSEFVEMFVGVGASRVRDLFEEAKKNAPCIIFIDEIDAIGKTRESGRFGGNDEREQTLNQLLAEMDGFDSSKGLLILAATNRPEVLDPALLRPGRFDRRVIVDRPDLKGRVAILKVHSKDVAMDETVDLDAIALATSGAVGSDLANMINEAAILAVKNGRSAVNQKDLLDAVEVVLVGKEKKDRILSPEERRIVSYHEVGHALLTALQKHTEPVQKITIIPRTMGALGYVLQVPEEEKYLNSKKELESRLVVSLGGRAAEEIVFDTVTTGAANDIEQATAIARAMITQYGMSEKFGLMGLASQENRYLDGRMVLNCGDQTATEIDHEIMKMLRNAYEEALRLLGEHRETMDRIAEHLIQKETITGSEFMQIFRECEGEAEPAASALTAGGRGDADANASQGALVLGEVTEEELAASVKAVVGESAANAGDAVPSVEDEDADSADAVPSAEAEDADPADAVPSLEAADQATEEAAAEAAVAEAVIAEGAVAEAAAAEVVVPEEEVAEEVVPEGAVAEAAAAEAAAAEVVVTEEAVTEAAAAKEAVPEEEVAEEVVPEGRVAEAAVPEEIVAEEVVPEGVVPEDIVPEGKAPEEEAPEGEAPAGDAGKAVPEVDAP